ncbi:uncharacterized protein LOC115407110 [Salarias fasciatus]|uniref:uncharacterized protein LOC115407110 n=1 Tax=Salarias fasciatus TaxID=181472 RepID=UPI001176F2F0|nr:uncharacterized protein LOC115407110 [Salarias fasciatus]
MDAHASHTRGDGDSGARACACGNKISSRDSHQVCSFCLGLQHARQAIEAPGSCEHCARFTAKSLRRRLARQASSSGQDPFIPAGDTPVTSGEKEGDDAVVGPRASGSWGSQLDLAAPTPLAEDVLELDYEDDYETISELLISEEESEDDVLIPSAQLAAQPATPGAEAVLGDEEGSAPAPSAVSMDMQAVCKRAASRLNIPWPEAITETTRSRYEGKKFPQAARTAKQLLPVFPELLDELSSSWKDHPFSGRSSIHGASSLDCEGMEKLGILRMPPMEPLVAAHLHPRLAASSRDPTLPSKADRIQSAMTERAYRAAALAVRALNVSSMLSAYQAELFEDMATKPDPAVWDEITVITDICLRVQRCAVQATGKSLGTMVLQERARWLNLSNLSDREKEDMLDMPITPDGIFGSALASMQQRCEAKKREDEALQLCLPRKAERPPAPAPRQSAAQATTGGEVRLAQKGHCSDSSSAVTERAVCRSAGQEEEEADLMVSFLRPVPGLHVQQPHLSFFLSVLDRRSRAQSQLTNKNINSSVSLPVPERVTSRLRSRSYTGPVNALTPGACAVAHAGCNRILSLGGAITPFMESPVTGGLTDAVTSLCLRTERWAALPSSAWVLRTISRGYRLQFAAVPPRFSGIVHSQARGESARVLQEEIHSLLEKRAICVVPPGQCQSGFYSRYFLVPKRGGTGIRPILDLRALNKYLRTYQFRMLTHASLLRMVRRNDWFTSVDLKDAYFHIPIYPPHRKYLRFAFQGVCYEYRVLPFGLSLSPRVFVRCTEAAIAPLRRQGIRLATYLDDWLLLARSREDAIAQTHILIKHLIDLGFMINSEKSVLSPVQKIIFLGLSLDSVSFTARLSAARVNVFRACLSRFTLRNLVPFRLCLRLLGLMASAILVVRLGHLYMRDFQLWVRSLRLNPVRHGARRVTVSAQCVMALRRWRHPACLVTGVPMGPVLSRKVITTDASMSGWGGICEDRYVRGVWSEDLQRAHINYLELLAVFLTLRRFLPLLRGHHVLVRTDNTTTVAYINRHGGLRSRQLHMLARRLILWSSVRLRSLRATHVPGALNRGADLLSRGAPLYGEWMLHPALVEQVWARFGRATVDLFASRENAQCPLFFSIRDPGAPLGVDALAHVWPSVLLYAFPPLTLIPPTLDRVREHCHTLVLIAPQWPAMHWLAEVYQLLSGQPWQLPLRRDMLSQAGGAVFHPHPERLALWAWPLSGVI